MGNNYKIFWVFFQIGIDIFLLVLGIGYIFSYAKDKNTNKFLKKRIIRIILTYLIAITLWAIFSILVGGGGSDFF